MYAYAKVTYEDASPHGHWWVATLTDPAVGATQARRLDQLEQYVKEVVVLQLDLPDEAEDDIEVVLDLSDTPLGKPLANLVGRKAEVEASSTRADEAMAEVVRAADTAGLTVRDLGAALGVSHQRAAVIRKRFDKIDA